MESSGATPANATYDSSNTLSFPLEAPFDSSLKMTMESITSTGVGISGATIDSNLFDISVKCK